jgi:genome maintenance exonuclease 1
LPRVEIEGKRYYQLPDGSLAKSVTTAIGDATDKTALYEWRQKIGEQEANKISTQAAVRGTALHSICEHYLLNNEGMPKKAMPSNVSTFKQIQSTIDEHIDVVYGIEARLYSYDLKAAGTADCIAEWDGIPSIIDFKTSRKEKKEEWIENYFLQATTYAMMAEERTGLIIPQFVILIAVDDRPEPQIFRKLKLGYIEKVRKIFA